MQLFFFFCYITVYLISEVNAFYYAGYNVVQTLKKSECQDL